MTTSNSTIITNHSLKKIIANHNTKIIMIILTISHNINLPLVLKKTIPKNIVLKVNNNNNKYVLCDHTLSFLSATNWLCTRFCKFTTPPLLTKIMICDS